MSEHHHDHGPSAQEAATDSHLRKKLAIAFGLVFSIVLVQAIGAFMTGSLALPWSMLSTRWLILFPTAASFCHDRVSAQQSFLSCLYSTKCSQ